MGRFWAALIGPKMDTFSKASVKELPAPRQDFGFFWGVSGFCKKRSDEGGGGFGRKCHF